MMFAECIAHLLAGATVRRRRVYTGREPRYNMGNRDAVHIKRGRVEEVVPKNANRVAMILTVDDLVADDWVVVAKAAEAKAGGGQ